MLCKIRRTQTNSKSTSNYLKLILACSDLSLTQRLLDARLCKDATTTPFKHSTTLKQRRYRSTWQNCTRLGNPRLKFAFGGGEGVSWRNVTGHRKITISSKPYISH